MIANLRLRNFRSYRDQSFEFGDSVNIVVGPNASGKTNLLEAVLVLARGKSYRNSLPKLIKHGKEWARLDAFMGGTDRVLKLSDQGPEFIVGGEPRRRLGNNQLLPVVLFEPSYLSMLSGEPGKRRDWLDNLISEVSVGYKRSLASYRRALTQRNSLLKQEPSRISKQIFAWDIRLSELAGQIVVERQGMIELINKSLPKLYGQIAGKKQMASLKYKPEFPAGSYSSKMLAQLGVQAKLDMARGFTGTGPHREDIAAYLNGQLLVEAGSRGEARSLLISLKLIEKNLLETAANQKPLLLLDDVFSELDGRRRQALVNHLNDYQTIITTTDADAASSYFGKPSLISLK